MFKKILIDLHAEIDLPCPTWLFGGDLEKKARYLEGEASDLTSFIRDHRSRDAYTIEIKREYQSVCEFCGYTEERDTDGSPVCCQKAIDEFEKLKVVKNENNKP